eukprot:RCo021533
MGPPVAVVTGILSEEKALVPPLAPAGTHAFAKPSESGSSSPCGDCGHGACDEALVRCMCDPDWSGLNCTEHSYWCISGPTPRVLTEACGILQVTGNAVYASNMNCIWMIVGPLNSKVTLSFESFSSESRWDRATVYTTPTPDPVAALGTLSGQNVAGMTFISLSGTLLVVFTSDGFLEYSGFTARWNITAMPNCSEWIEVLGNRCPEGSALNISAPQCPSGECTERHCCTATLTCGGFLGCPLGSKVIDNSTHCLS